MPKVFVTQEMSKLDYRPAEKFGEIVFLVRDDFSPVASSLINQSINTDIREKLTDFDPKVDFVVFSGSPTVAAAVFTYLGRRASAYWVLRWSNRDLIYVPFQITI